MNKQQVLNLLIEKLQEYEGQFIFHDQFINELYEIISKIAKGHENQFFRQLVKQFQFVKTQGTNVHLTDHNEILKHIKGGNWYSLHISDSIVNTRLLMSFSHDGRPVFLVCFNEKQGKRVTEYGGYEKLLLKRFDEIMKEV